MREPCQAIGAMQITRDLKNDFSQNFASYLSLIPKEVFERCEKVKNSATEGRSESVYTGDIPKIPDEILDYDLKDAISNIQMHQQIIEKQMESRRKCIELLIKSRCEFGSRDDAELFYSLDEVMTTLKERKAQILDAMELEGLDFEGLDDEDAQHDDGNEDQKPMEFSWLSKEEAENNRIAKKQKVE